MTPLLIVTLLAAVGGWAVACSSGATGTSCSEDGQCSGDNAVCLDDVEGGYCSQECDEDDDCCDDGACDDDVERVCSSYEDTGERYCFLSCDADEGPGGDQDVCDDLAAGFECRNTGGGIGRMVCLPPGGDDS